MNFYSKKSRRIIARVIVIILVLALIVPYIVNVLM